MSLEEKIFVAAGKKRSGPDFYENYVGQIKPADLPKIIWYDGRLENPPADFMGDDTTGNGSYTTPYKTFARAVQDVSLTKIYVLDRSLGGYFHHSYSDGVTSYQVMYVNTATGNDANGGTTPVDAKATWANARANVPGPSIPNPYVVIQVENDATLTDLIDFPTQGKVGQTLTLNRAPTFKTQGVTAPGGGERRGVVYGAGLFVVTFTNNGNTSLIITSPDGITWTARANPWNAANTGNAKDLCIGYPGGSPLFVCVGNTSAAYNNLVLTSPDGITWTARTTTTNATAVCWVQNLGLFVLAGKNRGGGAANRVMTSPNGITWTLRTQAWADNNSVFTSIATDGSTIVITGYNTSGGSTDGQIQTSSDGITWTNRMVATMPRLFRVRYHDGLWLVIADNAGTRNFWETTNPIGTWTKDVQNLPAGADNYGLGNSTIWGWVITVGSILYQRKSTGNTVILPDQADIVVPSGYYTTAGVASGYNIVSQIIGQEEVVLITTDRGGIAPEIDRVVPGSSNLRGRIINAVMHTSKKLAIASTGEAHHIDSLPTTGPAVDMFSGVLTRSKCASADSDLGVHGGGYSVAMFNLLRAPGKNLTIKGFAAVLADIEYSRNTMECNIVLENAGGTQKERFRDNIIKGNITAAAAILFEGGDVTGAGIGVIYQGTAFINPMITDFTVGKLDREVQGAEFDSFLCSISEFYVNGTGEKSDLGAWIGNYTKESVFYEYPIYLPRPIRSESIQHEKEIIAGKLSGLLGEIDIYNNPDQQEEIITISYGSLTEEFMAFFRYLEKQTDLDVLLNIDPHKWSTSPSLTFSGASAGDIVLTITAAVVQHGQRFTWQGQEYYIRMILPNTSAATRIVIDRELVNAIPAATVIPMSYPDGVGVFKAFPKGQRLSRPESIDNSLRRGYVITFVRKWQN